jgi:hypothetical protein
MKPPKKSPKISLRKTVKATMATANSVPLDAPGVTAKRGEDPAFNGSTAGRREEALKTMTTTSTTKGGGQGHRRVVVAPSSFGAAGAVANFRIAVVAVGNDNGVHRPQEVCQHCRAGIPISLYWNVFIPLYGKGEGKGGGIGGGGGGGEGGGERGGKGWRGRERGRW